jgi:hypothetical protein
MRIRIPRRFLLLGILLASLVLVSSFAPTASLARPIGWDSDPNENPNPKGDSDGGLQKSGTLRVGTNSVTATNEYTRTSWNALRVYLAAVRMGYGWRWTW